MDYSIVFLEKANFDIVQTFRYYSEIDVNLAEKFSYNLELTISDIQKAPLRF